MQSLRVVTWNIHKGVRGVGLARRVEVDSIADAISAFDADIICLQEVRNIDHRHARLVSWPSEPQAEYLLPNGYHLVYRSNATNRHGNHGNALISRWPVIKEQQHDISDHRFEQRGFLHVELGVAGKSLHVVVVHLGLIAGSRMRQIEMLRQFVLREVPANVPLIVAGDFNDWGERLHLPMRDMHLQTYAGKRLPTFPSRAPMLYLDRIYFRGLRAGQSMVPKGREWWRMSDHLPILGNLQWPVTN